MRLVVALGGNAIAPADTGGSAPEQTATISAAAEPLADLVAQGHDLVLTHGNGPQVGNLLLKNELAADIVPAMPLDWCVAQTQATIGFTMGTALEAALRTRGIERPVVPIVSRVLVAADDPDDTFVMPDLVDRPAELVRPLFEGRGFRFGSIKYEPYEGVEPGTVLRHTPLAGHPLRRRDAISLVVATTPDAES